MKFESYEVTQNTPVSFLPPPKYGTGILGVDCDMTKAGTPSTCSLEVDLTDTQQDDLSVQHGRLPSKRKIECYSRP